MRRGDVGQSDRGKILAPASFALADNALKAFQPGLALCFDAFRLGPEFCGYHQARPQEVRGDQKVKLLKAGPAHSSLGLRKVGRFRSCRVGLHCQVLGVCSASRSDFTRSTIR